MKQYLERIDNSSSRANRLRPSDASVLRFIFHSAVTFFSLAIIFAMPIIRKLVFNKHIDSDIFGDMFLAGGAFLVATFAVLRVVAECLNARVLRRSSRVGIQDRLRIVEKTERFRIVPKYARSMKIGAVVFAAAAIVSIVGLVLEFQK